MNSAVKVCLSLLLISLLASCAKGPNHGRYSQKYDSIPDRLPSAAELVEPTPKVEPPSPQGNRDYELFGRTWRVMSDARGFSETGVASWYGEKFHGHLTSNGEIYDMYAMSAAHKTLPLPTYVRVTNLNNDQSVVVRVNDRGPFHDDRIIDLSYVAAYKIGMLDTGTAPVRVEALHPPLQPNQLLTATPLEPAELPPQYFIQVHAGGNLERLSQEAARLQEIYQVPATTQPNNGLYRLVLGPFAAPQTDILLAQLRADGFTGVFRVQVQE